jgi:8-oxo-dGDP phosphatase
VSAADAGSPFRIVDQRRDWAGRRIAVSVVDVEGPDGSRHEREVVRHPGAVAVVPLHDDGSVTLVRQYRAAVDTDLWEIPAGLRDVEDEPTEETARRELAEEAGLQASRLDHLVTFHNSPGFTDEAVVIYLATELTTVPDDRQGIEEQHMVVRQMPLSEALSMVDDGRITDAKTVIAVLSAARRRVAVD